MIGKVRRGLELRVTPPIWVTWLVATIVLALAVAVVLMVTVPNGSVPDSPTRTDRYRLDAEGSIRATILQTIAGIVVVVGVCFTARSLYLSRETHLTDRLAKAVDQLGHDKPEVRVGGMYSLERLAGNSRTDRQVIVDVLSTYLKIHAGPGNHPYPRGKVITPDVQTALTLLVRIRA